METWQMNVVVEANELHDRIELLDKFLLSNNATKQELTTEVELLLQAQLSFMRLYYEVLQKRIERFFVN